MKNEWALGIDIGATKIVVMGINSAEETIDLIRLDTNAISTSEALIDGLVSAIDTITKKAPIPPKGVGIGMAGQIDAKGNILCFSHNFPNWKKIPLKATLEQKTQFPVFITNDVRAAAIAEWKLGAGKGCDDLVCLLIGTGIGGGVISGGRLICGSSNTAGELGHLTVDLNGPLCTCGNRGCLEALASGWAIAQQAKEQGFPQTYTAKDVINLFHDGDSQAKEIVEKAKNGLIAGAVSIVNAFNPQRLILSGGMVHGLPEIIEWIDSGVRKNALKAATNDLWVMKGHFEENTVAIGAACSLLK